MSFRPSHLVTALSSAAMLLVSAPAYACRGECEHAKAAAKGAAKPGDELAATCNCEGPSDCTCKKGQCKCKRCSKHHGATGVNAGEKKTELPSPVRGASGS